MISFIIRYTDSNIGMYCSFFTRKWGDEYATIDWIDDGRPERIQIAHVLAFTMKEQLPDPLDPGPGPDGKDVLELPAAPDERQAGKPRGRSRRVKEPSSDEEDVVETIEPMDEETEESETEESEPESSEPEESQPEDSEPEGSEPEDSEVSTSAAETEESESEPEDSEPGRRKIYDDFPYEDRGTTDTYVHNRDRLADKKPSLAIKSLRALLRGS